MKIQLFIFLLLFSSCVFNPGGDDRLKIINQTNYHFERSKNKKLNLFIYNLDLLKAYGIDTLIKRKIYRKLEYSEQELNRLNWMVTIEN